MYPAFKTAVAHVAPVFLDREGTVAKACDLIQEAARNGARLIAFPEAYIPAFPIWSALWAPIHNHDYFRRLADQSVVLPGKDVQQICSEARRQGVFVSIGLNERSDASVGCIWNTNLLIGDDGSLLNHHRKIVPTFFEKLVWSNGDGAGLNVVDTAIGRLGALICGENTNPLARFTLMAQGEQVHISSYPPIWPTRDPSQGANYDLESAIRIRAGAHSFEGKLFNVVASGFMDARMRAELLTTQPDAARILDHSPRGISVVIGPDGAPIGEFLQNDEGILYQEIDINRCVEPKQFHDVVGSYNRFDIFELSVNRTRLQPIAFSRATASEAEKPAPASAARTRLDGKTGAILRKGSRSAF